MTPSPAQINDRVQTFIRRSRLRGLKLTRQRTEIFRELAASTEHPDAEAVYQAVSLRLPGISRDTVYRTLSTLEKEGLIRRVQPLFESARYDANLDDHHHFVCTSCGLVNDFYSEDLDRLPIPKSVETLGWIESAQVEVRGICSSCVKRRETTRHSNPHNERNNQYE